MVSGEIALGYDFTLRQKYVDDLKVLFYGPGFQYISIVKFKFVYYDSPC